MSSSPLDQSVDDLQSVQESILKFQDDDAQYANHLEFYGEPPPFMDYYHDAQQAQRDLFKKRRSPQDTPTDTLFLILQQALLFSCARVLHRRGLNEHPDEVLQYSSVTDQDKAWVCSKVRALFQKCFFKNGYGSIARALDSNQRVNAQDVFYTVEDLDSVFKGFIKKTQPLILPFQKYTPSLIDLSDVGADVITACQQTFAPFQEYLKRQAHVSVRTSDAYFRELQTNLFKALKEARPDGSFAEREKEYITQNIHMAYYGLFFGRREPVRTIKARNPDDRCLCKHEIAHSVGRFNLLFEVFLKETSDAVPMDASVAVPDVAWANLLKDSPASTPRRIPTVSAASSSSALLQHGTLSATPPEVPSVSESPVSEEAVSGDAVILNDSGTLVDTSDASSGQGPKK